MKQTRYAFAGASSRALNMYMNPMRTDYAAECVLAGLYDSNPGRAKTVSDITGIPVYDSFDEMVKSTQAQVIVVTTVDAYHSDYIIRALELGCNVITEKPMTTDAGRCAAILEAQKRTGGHVTVTFNYRYAPFSTKIRKLLHTGAVGDVFSAHFEWLLDRNMDVQAHGASYFRRWNSRMKKSGGLLVHKSTHHFDLVNWWLQAEPLEVSAFGKLNLYGTPGGHRYAGGMQGSHCRACEHTRECAFYYRLNDDETRLYAANEHYDGYYKDGCVYAPDIDIYDTMAVNVLYNTGAMLTYSLNATCPYEGWRITINGSNGRLEAYMPETGPDALAAFDTIRVFDLENNVTEHRVTRARGGHGGGDARLLRMLFLANQPDPLGHSAGTRDGANSIMVGAAANISIREKRVVNLAQLLQNAGTP